MKDKLFELPTHNLAISATESASKLLGDDIEFWKIRGLIVFATIKKQEGNATPFDNRLVLASRENRLTVDLIKRYARYRRLRVEEIILERSIARWRFSQTTNLD